MDTKLIAKYVADEKEPIIAVVGHTASGKTDYSIAIATACKTDCNIRIEIINADSRQLYAYLNIGTAKVTPEEMQGIPHHALSVLDPRVKTSIADYQLLAKKIIADIRSRGAVPMLVGGSMLYVHAVTDHYVPLPKASEALRKKLTDAYDRDGGLSLHRLLKQLDPLSAEKIHRRNKVYLIRALEICTVTGKPASMQKTATSNESVLFLGVRTARNVQATSIAERTETLFKRGWVEEVASLIQRGYTADDPGMESHGYREILRHLLQNGFPKDDDAINRTKSSHELKQEITRKTLQFAKRQMTWWKSDPRIVWIKK